MYYTAMQHRQPVFEKENSEFEPFLLCLKIDLRSHSSHGKYKNTYIKYFGHLKRTDKLTLAYC